jgi:LmbE family N-acetylglucosaminyl deacetylase
VEAQRGASLLGATVEYVELDGDAHLEIKAVHALKIAGIIRRTKPGIVFAPSLSENQHPDHFRLGRLIRDAARLARYGGLSDLKQLAPHSIDQLLYYALTLESEPTDISPLLIDVSSPEVLAAWTAAMEAHESQVTGRNYVEIQLARARLRGLSAGVTHAIAVYPADAPVFDSLVPLSRGARQF